MSAFDLDATVDASAAEPFRFIWGATEFELPNLVDLPIEQQLAIIAAAEAIDPANTDPAQLLSTVRLVVGEERLAQMSATKPMSAVVLMRLLTAWMDYHRGALGKSPASSASSASTAKPSKATSRSGRARKTS